MEKIFKLHENGTTVRTEIVAGLTTFMTMAYIVALNPNLLAQWNSSSDLWKGVFLATCISSGIACFAMGLMANKPFALAPGMGINSFFGVVAASVAAMTGSSYETGFQAALCIVLLEGIVFLILSVLNIREKIVEAIPLGTRLGIGPAIGLMLMNIGLGSNAGVMDESGNMHYVMRDFFGALTAGSAKDALGAAFPEMVLVVLTMFIGLFLIVVLDHKKVKGAVLLGMLGGCVVYWGGELAFLGNNPFTALKTASWLPPFSSMFAATMFKFDFKTLMSMGVTTVITLVVTFCIIDMFDTIGTLVGTASRGGMLDKDGNMPQMKEALTADAIGTLVGSCTGTSTVTTFVESAAGVAAGGRTGLTAIVTGIIFFLCMFISPIAAIIPPAATSSALIYVGILMLGNLKKVNFEDPAELVPACLMLISMPISGSIGHGIGLGLIAHTVIMVFTGKKDKVSLLTYILSLIFLVKFFIPFGV